ncbi:MAG: GNAT family N-acetyltransferase [Alistipes sp.]|nr:GNAT family N-acetyltransferase [Alistipes sp.]MBO7285908.1 GNAT family N-acetyltransferase [Alistipes sp.]
MIRKATIGDIESIMGIVRSAQQALCELGIDQWQDGYPRIEDIDEDIRQGVGYIVTNGDYVLGYAAIVLAGEQAYEQIADLWRTSDKYVVVHRLCVDGSARRQGIALRLMQHAAHIAREHSISAFRIDTHKGNIRMLDMMQRLGFSHVGKIVYESGEREAYELNLDLSNTL